MDRDEIIDGEICDGCGIPIFFYGEQATECPQCGSEYKLSED
jgi:predicted RNA-binding Zn-ribbon protein involved in translation (DUF1610 family)